MKGQLTQYSDTRWAYATQGKRVYIHKHGERWTADEDDEPRKLEGVKSIEEAMDAVDSGTYSKTVNPAAFLSLSVCSACSRKP